MLEDVTVYELCLVYMLCAGRMSSAFPEYESGAFDVYITYLLFVAIEQDVRGGAISSHLIGCLNRGCSQLPSLRSTLFL